MACLTLRGTTVPLLFVALTASSGRAETALECYTARVARVEASSAADPGAGPENVLDWNWLSRWQSRGEGVGAWVKLSFAGPIRLGEVILVDQANGRGSVGAVRLEFSEGEALEYLFPGNCLAE